jgi:hypothetical protein
LGLCHRSFELGDKVYILMGDDMPFVLRPFGGNTFGFGGQSYVHGIMVGEALALKETDEGIMPDSIKDLAWANGLGEAPWLSRQRE